MELAVYDGQLKSLADKVWIYVSDPTMSRLYVVPSEIKVGVSETVTVELQVENIQDLSNSIRLYIMQPTGRHLGVTQMRSSDKALDVFSQIAWPFMKGCRVAL